MRRRSRALPSLFLALVMLAVACGDDGDGDEEGDGDELTPITVGYLPIADQAPFIYGIEQGFFEDEGLDVTAEPGPGGSALVPALLNGDLQFGFGEYVSLMVARQNDVELQVVANWVNGADTPDQKNNGWLVAPDSAIDSVEDLAGKTFGVNLLENLGEVTVRAILENHGVDHSEIRFVEERFDNMNAALRAGEFDVAWQVQPFVNLGENEGLVNLLDPMYETTPSMPLAPIFASESWLEENPETANAFYRAVLRSLEATSDEETMREAIVAHTDIDAALVEELPLGNWDPEIDRNKLAHLGELATRYGILDEEPDLDELIWTAD